MKKSITLLCAIFVFFTYSFANKYTIKADIKGINGKVYLAHVVENKFVNIDSTEIIEGKFAFKGSVEEPEVYFLLFKENTRT